MTNLEEALKSLVQSQIIGSLGDFLSPVEPESALAFFKSLIPTLDLDAGKWTSGLRRRAFTMVAATEETLLEKVHAVIAESLRTGDRSAPQQIDDLLDEMGCGQRDESYSEMVFRTNALGALNQGAEDEILNDPMMEEQFPVWMYSGIEDGREGEDHRPNFSHVFPNSMTFESVRGARPFRCRCARIALHKSQWAKMMAEGKELTTFIPRERMGFA